MNLFFKKPASVVALILVGLIWPVLTCAQEHVLSKPLSVQLASEEAEWAEKQLAWAQLREFYAPDYLPIWLDETGPTARAEQWWHTLQAAESEGLEPERYNLKSISQYWNATEPQQKVWLELLLTDAFFHYSTHVRAGRLKPRVLDPDWHLNAPEVDPVVLLRKTLAVQDISSVLATLPPPHAGYKRLREVLAQYRQLAGKSHWPVIPAKPKLYWGMWHNNILLLRRRLILTGDLSARHVEEPRFFDQSLKEGVERFQRRHGLKVDGIVGAGTIQRLNTPLSEYIKQIKLNMERWRWLPRKLGERYILVNTASYQLHVVDHEKPRLAMRVITGTTDRPTPVVGGQINNLIINPYWYIPKKIAVEDLLPKQQTNPNFFSRNRIRVLDGREPAAKELNPKGIDWRKLTPDNFPYTLRQDPGPGNSLGNIKFPFLNSFAIYLHDTPQRHLFGYNKRAFSSGCVRVEEPMQLASYLLNGEQGWTLDKLQEKIDTGETLTVRLPKPIPIYLVYWTVWVGADNAVYFQKDIYDRDRPLAECG